jgi:Fe-S-cluster containining protein
MRKLNESSVFRVSHVHECGYKPKELSIPCFRCGVCCTKYQVRLNLVEARKIANELRLAWDEWLDLYVDQSWPGTNSLLLRQCKGGCVFLEQIKGSNMTRCVIQHFKPSSCREWIPNLYQRECQQELTQCWGLTANLLGPSLPLSPSLEISPLFSSLKEDLVTSVRAVIYGII